MIAWYGEQRLKDAAMARLREHRRLDEIAQGIYYQDGRGCHLGCLAHDNDNSHAATERMFGIELRVAYWLEAVFEGLPQDKCSQWVIESTEAIPVGADLSRCHHHLVAWLLGDQSPSAAGNNHEIVKADVYSMRALHDRAANGEQITDDEWSAAWSAAASAAWSAAWSAESAAWSAESAAVSAAWSAESAAESAAWSAAESAAESAAWSAAASAAASAAWEAIAAKSIEIFKTAPVRLPSPDEQCGECVSESMAMLSQPEVVLGRDAVKGGAS